jgi:hypothetical protein
MSETYKLTIYPDSVQRMSDGAFIPNDERNPAWREYQEWLAAGNVALAADPPPSQSPA